MSVDIGKARYMFDRFGQVPEGAVSPVILHSWERSQSISREVRTPKLTPEEFQQKLINSAELLKAAEPVEQLLSACALHTMVFLSDGDPCTVHQICYEQYMNQLGRVAKEEMTGTSAVNLCCRERMPIMTVRQENWALRYQHCSIASAPIFSGEDIIGIISLVTNFGADLPGYSLPMLGCAARLIEERMNAAAPPALRDCASFIPFIESVALGVVISDAAGGQCISNAALRSPVGKAAQSMGKLFDRKPDRDAVTGGIDASAPRAVSVMGREMNCLLSEHISSGGPDGGKLLVTVLSADKHTAAAAPPKKNLITDAQPTPESKVSLIGDSPAWYRVKQIIDKVSKLRYIKVLIEGESGTGKEQVARAIHTASGRSGPMITVNCGALPRDLLQSELFGYVDGAFTGAKRGGNSGKFEQASGGTLFLDEIGEMPLDMQVSLLRVLEDRKVIRLGSSKPISVDLNIIAATNRRLMDEVAEGRFRDDLYYRLSAVMITLPPLRERRSDIPLLVRHLVQRIADSTCINPRELSEGAMRALLDYDWPGNVRELQNVLEYALVLGEDDVISRETIDEVLSIRAVRSTPSPGAVADLRTATVLQKTEIIRSALEECDGNVSRAAKLLGVSRNTIYRHLNGDIGE